MSKSLRKRAAKTPPERLALGKRGALGSDETKFAEVVALIEAARNRAYQAVNTELVSLYWQLGETISQKLQ